MSPPDLPLDVIIVVSQFLAGCYAFGSLAALHLADHNVRDATLSVLYETVLMNNFEHLPYYKTGTEVNPEGFRFTR